MYTIKSLKLCLHFILRNSRWSPVFKNWHDKLLKMCKVIAETTWCSRTWRRKNVLLHSGQFQVSNDMLENLVVKGKPAQLVAQDDLWACRMVWSNSEPGKSQEKGEFGNCLCWCLLMGQKGLGLTFSVTFCATLKLDWSWSCKICPGDRMGRDTVERSNGSWKTDCELLLNLVIKDGMTAQKEQRKGRCSQL